YSIWAMRKSLNRRHVMPVIIGSIPGVPVGVWLLSYADPSHLRLGVGLLLIAYGLNGLLRPRLRVVPANTPFEIVLGFFNGILGGMTGLSGVFVTIWASMRGWSKDTQRSVYQPVLVASAVLTGTSLAIGGAITPPVVTLFLYGLPVMGAGMLVGMKLYGHLDDAGFRKVILVLLLISGLVLFVPEVLGIR
ncbi:MAG: sulfite exporter TauE/SafE family protein, partial [Pseudolabrys sp.]|nr:sulfite exporter TauE/SafE family protein [Pseudolabrys sp.]